MPGVVVGVDGSEESGGALDWALREGAARRVTVTAALAWDPSRHDGPEGPDAVSARKRALVEEWVDAARARTGLGPDVVPTTAYAEQGSPAAVLLSLAEPGRDEADAGPGADLLVVGRCGRGRLGRMVLGSVPTAVLQHATVPVTVVRGTPDVRHDPARPVVVGVDGSATSVQALRHGADVARRSGAALEALFCWQIVSLAPLPDSWGWTPPIDDYEKFATLRLDAALEAAGVDLPDDRLVRSVRHVQAAKGVIEASSHAERLVLGNRGIGGFDRLLLGSVSRHAVEYAHCPVTVVRPPGATHPSGATEA
jgi:nucleotide-binding universal stress UspA family protein